MKINRLDVLAWILAAGAGIAALLVTMAFAGWPFTVLENFRPHALVVAGVAGVALLAMRRWKLTALVVAFASLNIATIPRASYATPSDATARSSELTVVWANLARNPAALAATIDYAREQKADLILGAEYPFRSPEPDQVAADYPYGATGAWPNVDVFVLSRLPLLPDAVERPLMAHHRQVASFGVVMPDGRRLNVIAAHPYPPLSPAWLANYEVVIADVASRAKPPFLIAGDFNVTPWASQFASVPGRRIGALLPAQTWMSSLPLAGLTIDHFKISPELAAGAFEVGPPIGSDHYPILTRIHFAGD